MSREIMFVSVYEVQVRGEELIDCFAGAEAAFTPSATIPSGYCTWYLVTKSPTCSGRETGRSVAVQDIWVEYATIGKLGLWYFLPS
jgi:hypothetical protein